ncbi:MAG: hypothetical protein IJR05_04655 [Acidaminococcaceae bacterium]|nr:hypothetical protein [Acidaminococcaceae bacterium]
MMQNVAKTVKQKGQGIVEYALLLAFIVGIAMMLNGAGLKNSVIDVYDYVADFLAYRTYTQYYGELHNATNSQLASVANAKRVKADQEGLQALVQNLLGLSKEDALTELQKLMPNATMDNVNPDANGNSKTFTLLTYWDHYDASNPYVTLGHDNQMNAIGYVTGGQATTTDYKSSRISGKTISEDRFFYSDGMTGDTNQRTITAQLHYEDNKVKSVSVVAHKGNANGAVADNLNITVTGQGWRGYSVN